MYSLNSKFSTGKPNSFDKSKSVNNILFGVVTTVGKVPVNSNNELNRSSDVRFNADEHAIRCRIVGSKYDNKIPDSELPNCFPLLPKHLNLVPKINEVVLIMVFGDDEKYGDRVYIGPITSSLTKLNLDTIDGTALSNFAEGLTRPSAEISKIPSARGIYQNPQHVIIEGRNNTDIIQRDNEVLIRSGKFVLNNPLVFNQKNPAYIQIKSNQNITDSEGNTKTISVNNIVADKINLLTYSGGQPEFNNLTKVDEETGEANYITDDQLDEILANAHPLVFGDLLVEYLRLFKMALLNHVHNGNGNKSTDRTDGGGTLPLEDFVKNAERLEKEMLSRNIRIN